MPEPRPPASLPTLGFIGAGRLASCLARAWARRGYAVTSVASRSPASAQSLADALPGCLALGTPQQVVEASDVVFLGVPDDAIAEIAAALRYGPSRVPGRASDSAPGKSLVHCSGASPVELLDSARRQGVATGGFHPLYLFSGSVADVDRLAGCAVTIEAAPPLRGVLAELAHALNCKPMELPTGGRMLYHAAANYAASFVLAGLSETVALWREIGLDERDTLAAAWPLIEGTLRAASEKGLAGALAGPVSRGDAAIVRTQLEQLTRLGGDHAALYALLTRRAVALARRRPVPPPALDEIERLLGDAGKGAPVNQRENRK